MKIANIPIKPTRHVAQQGDHSSLDVRGEAHVTLNFGKMSLPIDALVMDTLHSDILVGVPFCKSSSIKIDLEHKIISLQDTNIPDGAKPQDHHDIYFTESFILHNDSSKVVFPGEVVEIQSDSLNGFE